ncbi:DNA-binding protein [Klebsiella pneumoniae]|uniref:DNA-binding protein n=1 Tax=Klebsiella pneumoniae TaxID=573 RepID=UPI000BB112A8|nr:DNA-binding protein [Klebsiella pneumoniae]PBD53578.1 DNA-binding protein [Klebsiella pneumoniae]
MAGRIDYDIEKYQFTEAGETPRLREQWREVYLECRQLRAGAEERLRIALLNVDYVTSFELPFRLLLVRAPQLIADVRETLQLSRKAAVFNGKRYGCVYSLKQDLQAVPEAFHYRLANRIRRVDATGLTAAPYQQIAREIKPARERLRQALNAGLPVTALAVAADIAQLRRSGMAIVTTEVEVSDNLFNTTRRVPVYRLASE